MKPKEIQKGETPKWNQDLQVEITGRGLRHGGVQGHLVIHTCHPQKITSWMMWIE